jgi:hypothetical protein
MSNLVLGKDSAIIQAHYVLLGLAKRTLVFQRYARSQLDHGTRNDHFGPTTNPLVKLG